ncbi:MAG: hypothetical protein AAFU49_05170 [Pseudomonadota bacterium]
MNADQIVILPPKDGETPALATPLDRAGATPFPAPPNRRASRVNWLALLSFFLIVALPITVIGTYYANHASDQYTASSRFTVREIKTRPLALEDADGAPDRIGSPLATEAISGMTYVVANYLGSRALMEELRRDMGLEAMFRRGEADFWARLPEEASAEDIYDYWRDQIRVAIDGPSGIVTLRVRAFAPEDTLVLSMGMLARAEALVNALSGRQKADAKARAIAEAAESERRLQASIDALSAFRDRERLLNPLQEADETVRLMAELTTERIRLESQLRVLSTMVEGDPVRGQSLRTRLEKLTADIAQLRDRLAADAGADRTIASALGRFEELEIRRRFAATLYGQAQTRLIEAEIDLARQSVFLNVFDPPLLPDESRYPRRVPFTLLAFVALAAAWAILALIWASVADHRMDARL